MKILSLTLLAGLLLQAVVFAQSHSVDWYKVTRGSGTSTGGIYSVTGTIGQHDAGGAMTGVNYSLTGRFWISGCNPAENKAK